MMQQNPHLLLMGVLHFSAADLEANRRGQLSPAQRHKLETARLRDAYMCALVLALVVALEVATYARLMVLIFSAAVGISIALALWARTTVDLQGTVRAVTGQPAVRLRPLRGYDLMINGERFNAPRAIGDAFTAGRLYRLYVTEGGSTLISAEVVG